MNTITIIAERRQSLLFEEEDRVRRRLILQLLHLMIIVKESNELVTETKSSFGEDGLSNE